MTAEKIFFLFGVGVMRRGVRSVSSQGYSVVLDAALELALVDHVGFKLIEIYLPLPAEKWG